MRNVAELVDRIPADPKPPDDLHTSRTPEGARSHRRRPIRDRVAARAHGLRRGEVAGLRWSDIDLEHERCRSRLHGLRFGKHLVEDTPKSRAGRRTLPIPDHLAASPALGPGHPGRRQALVGEESTKPSGFVVVNEWGAALSPHALTSRWARMLKAAGVRHIRTTTPGIPAAR